MSSREALLWLAIITAGGALALAVIRPGRTSTANPALAVREDGEARAAHLSAAAPVGAQRHTWPQNTHAEQGTIISVVTPDANVTATVAEVYPQSGYEMPFAPASAVAGNAVAVPNEAAALCAALRDALAEGRSADISAVRGKLLSLGPVAVPSVAALLQAETERLQIEAVRLLVQLGEAQGLVLALGKVLSVPRDSTDYGLFLAAFADNRSPAVAQWVADTLGKTQYAETRERMLDLLRAMRGPAVVTALEQAAIKPADNMHAQDAIDSLAARQDPAETESLATLLLSDDAAIREAVAFGLAGIGSGDVCHILADESEYTAGCAMALASVSSSYAQETLLALATDSRQSVAVRTSAIRSLSRQPSYRVHTILANAAIQEQSAEVISAMQTALSTTANIEPTQNNALHGSEPAGELWF